MWGAALKDMGPACEAPASQSELNEGEEKINVLWSQKCAVGPEQL